MENNSTTIMETPWIIILHQRQKLTTPTPTLRHSHSPTFNYSNKNSTNSTNPTWTTTHHPPLQTRNPPTIHKRHLPKWTHVEPCSCRMTFMGIITTQLLSTSFHTNNVKSYSKPLRKSHICKVLSSDNLFSSNFSKRQRLNESNKSNTRM